MNILSIFSILAGPFSGLEGSEIIINFLLLIDSKIYELFGYLYGLYISIASAKIFNVEVFDYFVKNIYIIFGVVALFILAFFLLQNVVNPEGNGTKDAKDFIMRFVLAIGLTFLIPFFFDFLYDFQYSILKYGTIPKITLSEARNTIVEVPIYYKNELGQYFCEDLTTFYDEKTNPCKIYSTVEKVDKGEAVLRAYGYGIAYDVFSGFLYPSGLVADDELVINASDYFTAERGASWGIWGCIAGAGLVAVGAVVTYFTGGLGAVGGFITAKTGTAMVLGCLGLGALGGVANAVGGVIDAEKYPWTSIVQSMEYMGDYSLVPALDGAIVTGHIEYSPIISTVAGIILVYLIFSFCLDLGVRAAKLVLYQLLAPLSFIISAIPSKKDLMSKWFKAVFTIWMEVFIRIVCVCGVAMLIRNLNLGEFESLGGLAKAIIVLGLVTFAKQFPRLLGDILGFDSGNLKLGIKEKLAEGGAFTAGALVGAGATALLRNTVAGAKGVKNKFLENKKALNDAGKTGWKANLAAAWQSKGAAGKMLGSMAAGTVSGAFRGGKAGWSAKNWGDMTSAAGKGAKGATDARIKRASYKASHGGTIGGAFEGHFHDMLQGGAKWLGIEEDYTVLQAEQNSADSLLASVKKIGDISEDYIVKHQSEFFAKLTEDQENAIAELRKKIANTSPHRKDKIQKYEQQIAQIQASTRLDYLEAAIKEAEKSGDAIAIAEATNRYKKAFKDIKDGFASSVFSHEGASKEAIAIQAELDSINNKLREEVNSQVVSLLRSGRANEAGKTIVGAQEGDVRADNAADFLKQLKSAAEVTTAEISAERSKLERRQKKDK